MGMPAAMVWMLALAELAAGEQVSALPYWMIALGLG